MKKILSTALILLLTATLLVACGAKSIPIGDVYSLESAKKESSFLDTTATEGNVLVVLQIITPKANIDKLQTDFFSPTEQKAQITDGANTAECSSLILTQKGEDIAAALIFEVPQAFDFSKQTTLNATNISPVMFNVK